MTLKEQSQAVKLLGQLFDRLSALPRDLLSPDDVELLDQVERFLNHDQGAPESHGQRRS